MTEIHATGEQPSTEERGIRPQGQPYETPRLVGVGNIREFLATGSFSGDDQSGMGPQSADQPPG